MIIGVTGYAGSGKDTVAEILVKEHGFVRYAFADKLREMAYAINPTIDVTTFGDVYPLRQLVDANGWDHMKRTCPQVREFLQNLGVWHRDNVDEDFWVDLVWEEIGKGFYNEYGEYRGWDEANVVITDVRFPNEAKRVREYWGQLWRVHRPGVGPVNGHISEQLDLAADVTIWNGGTIAQLMLKVHRLIEEEKAA